MLESNLAPKGSPAPQLRKIFILLRLRMSPYAYAYRTCKHPCAYACVVRVNLPYLDMVNQYHDLSLKAELFLRFLKRNKHFNVITSVKAQVERFFEKCRL